jgi:type I restriction enzyme S subunit
VNTLAAAPRSLRGAGATVVFGDVVTNVAKTCPDPSSAGLTRFVGLAHLSGDSPYIEEWGELTKDVSFTRRFDVGQTLFAKRRVYQRKAGWAEFPGVCSGDILVFAAGEGLRADLLPFIVQSDAFLAFGGETSAGSLSPRTRWKDLARFEFHLPDKDSQARLARVFWAAEETRRAYRRALNASAVAAQALRNSFFEGYDGHHATVADLFDAQLGKKLVPAERYGPQQREYLTNINVRWDAFDLNDVKTMHIPNDEIDRYQVKRGDILMCEGRGVGRCAVWDGEEGRFYHHMALHRLRAHEPLIDPYFFVEYMHYAVVAGVLLGLTGTSTIPHLSNVKLRTLEVPVPSLEEQRRLVARIRSQRKLQRKLEEAQAKLIALRRSATREAFDVQ